MHIIVPIKQVPDIKKVKMDEETGTMIREGIDTIINPLDLYAIESALNLKDLGIAKKITAISMGPITVIDELKEAIAMGIDSAILVSDKAFAGSDTWATSLVLSKAIKMTGKFDMVICGERAIDGDTGQVGPELAASLNLPVITFVNKIISFNNNILSLSRRLEHGVEYIETKAPIVLTVIKEINFPRLPTYRGKKEAKIIDIPVWDLQTVGLSKENTGLKGSPTKVVKIFKPNISRKCKKITALKKEQIEDSANELINFLKNEQ